MAEDVGKAQQQRRLEVAGLQVLDQLPQVDRQVGVAGGVGDDVPGLVDREVFPAPAGDAVELGRVGDRPCGAVLLRGGGEAG